MLAWEPTERPDLKTTTKDEYKTLMINDGSLSIHEDMIAQIRNTQQNQRAR